MNTRTGGLALSFMIFVVVVLAALTVSANAATDTAQLIDSLTKQTGGSSGEFALSVSGSSNGAFVPEVNRALQSAQFDRTSQRTLTAIFSGGGGATSAPQLIADLNVANGVTSLAGSTVGSTTTDAIGGGGGVVQSRQQAVLAQRRGLVQEFGSNAALAAASMNCDNVNRLWFSPFHTNQKGEKNGVTEAYKFKANGVSVGYDRAFGAITAGAAFTFSNGDYKVEDSVNDNTIKSYGISGYAQYFSSCNSFFVTVSGGYNRGNNNWNRLINTTNVWQRGKNHSNSYWAGANMGRDFTFGGSMNAFTFTPTIGVYWSETKGTAYRSAGAIDMTLGETEQRTILLPVEVEVRRTFSLGVDADVTVKAQAGYSYNFKNEGAKGSMQYNYVGSQVVGVVGTAPGRSGYNLGTGVKFRYKNLDVGVDYRYDHRKKFEGHRVSATVGVNF